MKKNKFRCWDEEKKKMYYPRKNDELSLLKNGWILWNALRNIILAQGEYKDLLQFTGLLDKNGKDSFHKDICEDSLGNKYTIEWNDIAARFVLVNMQNPSIWLSAEAITKLEVIGNVMENPELLEKANGTEVKQEKTI